jgi:hypothetical protein
MAELPPNVHSERRLDENAGSRKVIEFVRSHEAKSEQRLESFREEILGKLEGHVSYKVLTASILTVAAGIIAGVLTLTSTNRSQVEESRKATDSKIEKLETNLQAFKSETGAEVKGIYRFLLEKQKPEIVKRDVEEQKRETAPPPEPINPLTQRRKR